MLTPPRSERPRTDGDADAVRARIVEAAFAAFAERGYAATSTLEIATRARVSKRELYALVGNKQQLLVAGITERARRLRVPTDVPSPEDRATLERVLVAFGTQLLRETTDPGVIAVFRLAIAEAMHAPEVAQALDSIGREATRAGLRQIMTQAQSRGLVEGRPAELADEFGSLLWGNVLVSLLLGVIPRPSAREFASRARAAAAAFLRLHPASSDAASSDARRRRRRRP